MRLGQQGLSNKSFQFFLCKIEQQSVKQKCCISYFIIIIDFEDLYIILYQESSILLYQ